MCSKEVNVLVASTYSTDSDNESVKGIYEFADVPDGEYNLTAVKNMSEIASGMKFWMAGSKVTIVNGQPVAGREHSPCNREQYGMGRSHAELNQQFHPGLSYRQRQHIWNNRVVHGT